jgi:hypothetical protein
MWFTYEKISCVEGHDLISAEAAEKSVNNSTNFSRGVIHRQNRITSKVQVLYSNLGILIIYQLKLISHV